MSWSGAPSLRRGVLVLAALAACDDSATSPGATSSASGGLDGGSSGSSGSSGASGGTGGASGALPDAGAADAAPSGFPACVTAVAVAGTYSCALTTKKKTLCWGSDSAGQVSTRVEDLDSLANGFGQLNGCGLLGNRARCWGAPRNVTRVLDDIPVTPFSELTMGIGPVCGVGLADGKITCWAEVLDLGAPTTGGFAHVAVGNSHLCTLTPDGTAACSGANEHGETNVPADTKFTQLDAGQHFTCGITTAQRLVCWGDPQFRKLEAPAGTFTRVTAARGSACAIRTDGTIVCWGEDGIGPFPSPSGTFTQMSASRHDKHACAVTTDRSVVCWGEDAHGSVKNAPRRCGS